MAFSRRQKAIAKAIVSVFETGKPLGKYTALVVLRDGAGISYGSHQATHGSGTLYKIVKKYTEISNSAEAKALRAYLPLLSRTGKNSAGVIEGSRNQKLKELLITAGNDKKMKFAQDFVFLKNYLEPAMEICEGSGFKETLSLVVIFDSLVHGSYRMIRDRVPANLSEKAWIKAYTQRRLAWLSTSKANPLLKHTVYRPNTFLALMNANNWSCNPPFNVHGLKITEEIIKVHEEILGQGEVEVIPVPVQEPRPEPQPQPEPVENIGEAGGTWEEDDLDLSDEEIEDVVNNFGPGNEDEQIPDSGEPSQPPIDGYPNEPKPGEQTPDKPAQPGEPVVGGRPTDPPIVVTPPVVDKPSGWAAWEGSVKGWIATLGITGASFGGLFSGLVENPTLLNLLLYIGVGALIVGALIWFVYMVIRAIHLRAREKEAFELTKLEMQFKSDPTKYNVAVNQAVVSESKPSANGLMAGFLGR